MSSRDKLAAFIKFRNLPSNTDLSVIRRIYKAQKIADAVIAKLVVILTEASNVKLNHLAQLIALTKLKSRLQKVSGLIVAVITLNSMAIPHLNKLYRVIQ